MQSKQCQCQCQICHNIIIIPFKIIVNVVDVLIQYGHLGAITGTLKVLGIKKVEK